MTENHNHSAVLDMRAQLLNYAHTWQVDTSNNWISNREYTYYHLTKASLGGSLILDN